MRGRRTLSPEARKAIAKGPEETLGCDADRQRVEEPSTQKTPNRAGYGFFWRMFRAGLLFSCVLTRLPLPDTGSA